MILRDDGIERMYICLYVVVMYISRKMKDKSSLIMFLRRLENCIRHQVNL